MLSYPIVTRAEVKAACNIRDSNTEFDDVLDHLAKVATGQLESVTGRFFTQQEVTEYFRTGRTFETVPDIYGVSELGAVTRVKPSTIRLRGIDIDPDTFDLRYDYLREWGDDTIVEPVDYILDVETSVVRLLFGTRESERSIKVTYTSGYEAAPYDPDGENQGEEPYMTLSAAAPAYLKEACLLQVVYLRSRRRPDNVGLTGDRSVGKGESFVQTMSWAAKEGVTPEALGLIRSLKRPVVGRY